jgi:hypothetical protein
MIKALVLSLTLGALVACSDIKPREEKATIVSFDNSYSICGGSWIIQSEGKQLRALTLPDGFRQANTDIWIKYESDPLRSQDPFKTCNFINVVSIRKR